MPRDITPRRSLSARQRFAQADESERLEAQVTHSHHMYGRCMQIAVLGFVIGLLVVAIGAQRSMVSAGASGAPVEVSLVDLEDGAPPPNPHLVVGPHVAIYRSAITSTEVRRGDERLQFVLYPVVSRKHPYLARIRALTRGEKDDTGFRLYFPPDSPILPHPDRFAVLVKSFAFLDEGAIPRGMVDRESLQGLLVNRIWRPDGELREQLQWRFPKLNLDDVLILQEGRTPSSEGQSLLVVAGGLLLSAGSAVTFVFFLRRRPPGSRRRRTARRR